MKLKNLKSKAATALLLCSSLSMVQPLIASAKPAINGNSLYEEEKPLKKNKAKSKSLSTLNNASVKIFPDALKREMHVVAKENDGKEITFFVFDIEGTLLQNFKMMEKDHTKISGLPRGAYIYRVFCGDEETAAGKFEIR